MIASESGLQSAVLEEATARGWLRFHARPGFLPGSGRWVTPMSGDAGFPDVVLAHVKHGVIFVEFKGEKGKLSPEQKEWLSVLHECEGVAVFLWRPSDWDDGTIGAVLAGGLRAIGGRRSNL